mmetsp:Transcript_49547/g.124590  ORF Transcript_49547/g.124590 Transcript_49547/m.124590 type:complete len:92 (-) Transcript_49547:69-344(-)
MCGKGRIPAVIASTCFDMLGISSPPEDRKISSRRTIAQHSIPYIELTPSADNVNNLLTLVLQQFCVVATTPPPPPAASTESLRNKNGCSCM